jgi:hypothetical protein
MTLAAVRGPGDAGRAAAGAARSSLSRPGRLATADGGQDGSRLRQHVPPERGQRGDADRHEERDRGHGEDQAQPVELPLAPRCPRALTGAGGAGQRARHRLQPGRDRVQAAPGVPGHPGARGHQPGRDRVQAAPGVPGHPGARGHQPGDRQRVRRGQAGADPLQAVARGLDRVHRAVQRAAQEVLVVAVVLAHASRSSTSRRAVMARAAWLLTVPRLIPSAEAIWASDMSA